jgi:GNAT superfamily N-acetyltransferase
MTSVTIELLRVPDTLEDDGAADFLTAVEVSRQVRISTWGNDDLAYTAGEMLAVCHDPYEWYVMLVARLDGVIVGRAGIALPLDDSTDLAHVTLDVLPGAQGRGVGRDLLEAAETFVRGENRRIVIVETNHAAETLAEPGASRLSAANGVGDLPLSNREVLFAHKAGYELEQVEQFGVCPLPLAPELITELTAQAGVAQSGAYAVHQWTNSCPDKWAEEIVRLERDYSGNGLVDESWNAEMLRESEELAQATGRHTLVSAAECLKTGELVAFTSISVLGDRSDVVFQDDTVVVPEHRGRELGLLIKVSNLQLLAREFPQSRAVYTWNAADNTYMLDVNTRLGFIAAGVTGQWQKEFEFAH